MAPGARSSLRRAVAVLVACLTLGAGASSATAATAGAGEPPELEVMTRNLFLGTGFEPLLSANQSTFLQALSQLWANVQATDFRQRAVALAAEIDRVRPDVIGLQEAVLWRTQSPSDWTGGPPNATNVAYDFVEILLEALEARGLRYRSAVLATNSDLEVPVPLDGIDVRITDRDAILVRQGVEVVDTGVHPFGAVFSVTVAGVTVTLPRTWQEATIRSAGNAVRVVNTHLEPLDDAVKLAQARELVGALAGDDGPVVLLGDFNAPPVGSQVTDSITAAGFTDAWAAVHPSEPGLTCCHHTSLTDPTPDFDERIDYVFMRGGPTAVAAEVVGEEPADRTASGLWPSDHAGVVATLALPVADTTVEAALVSVTTTKTGQRRTVKAVLRLQETVDLTARLARRGTAIATRSRELDNGRRTVTLVVPRATARGPATLRLTLLDEAGNRRVFTRAVSIPPLG